MNMETTTTRKVNQQKYRLNMKKIYKEILNMVNVKEIKVFNWDRVL